MPKDTWGPKTMHSNNQSPPLKMLSSKHYQSEELKPPYPPQKNVVPELSKKLSAKMPLPWKMRREKESKRGTKERERSEATW